ncbi:hypothetical protein SAMN06314019_10272 [Epsilonproteobacteria bacterium SCGC AD-311-C15]|nr:hypothetical protein SAMN06314019_10272 [Epsilonproteobacteria bacterium SCGC AD-311-C15]
MQIVPNSDRLRTNVRRVSEFGARCAETVVVMNDNEYVWPFMELSMMVLVAHTQRSIDDIVEAYLFKELHDLAY